MGLTGSEKLSKAKQAKEKGNNLFKEKKYPRALKAYQEVTV